MSVFKRKRNNRRGEPTEQLTYTVEFTDHRGTRRRLSAFRDRAASEEMQRNLVRLTSYRQSGLLPDGELIRFLENVNPRITTNLAAWGVIDSQRAAGGKPLMEHAREWRIALDAKGNTDKHAKGSFAKVERLAKACGWSQLSDMTATGFDAWRTKARAGGLSGQSMNHYLTAAKGFCNWLMKNGRLTANPLQHLQKKTVTDSDRRHVRMASEDGELERLLAATMAGEKHHGLNGGERALLYRLAVETGFRCGECQSLTKASFSLESASPSVTVESGRAKNRKARTNPISRELASALKEHMALFLPTAPAFPGMWKGRGAEMLRKDLQAAGLPYRDEYGQVRDFHSLRKTFGTRLSRAGVPLAVAQRLLDHSTPVLTANYYTGVMLADKTAAIAKLSPIGCGQRQDAGDLAKTGTEDIRPFELPPPPSMADKETENATAIKREAGDSFMSPGKTQSAQGADTPGDTNGANLGTFYWTYVNGESCEQPLDSQEEKVKILLRHNEKTTLNQHEGRLGAVVAQRFWKRHDPRSIYDNFWIKCFLCFCVLSLLS